MREAFIVLGLGNPGERYRRTRHNLGSRVVELLAERARAPFRDPGGIGATAWTAELTRGGGRVVLAKPRTYMNRSGEAASALCARWAVDAERLIAVYDDADLPLGRVRLRSGGGAGGHNGVRSAIEALGTERFARVRLGVAGGERARAELAVYVLGPFEDDEQPIAEELVHLGAEAVETIVDEGLQVAMNSYNARSVEPSARVERSEEEG
jgi:PTH1 family peptidyl-tRNA hydrolase